MLLSAASSLGTLNSSRRWATSTPLAGLNTAPYGCGRLYMHKRVMWWDESVAVYSADEQGTRAMCWAAWERCSHRCAAQALLRCNGCMSEM